MFTNKISTKRCFLCFCKGKAEKTFYAHSTLCLGSEQTLKMIIEDLARSAKQEVQLSEDTLLCLECCKIFASFIDKRCDLIERIKKAMTHLDDELDELHEELIIKEENLSDTETAQDPFLNHDFAAASAATLTTFVKNPQVIEQRVKEEPSIVYANSSDNEIGENDQTISLLTHPGGTRLQCDLCDFASYIENRLILHKNTHKGLKETQCPFCNKIFSKKYGCLRHMETQRECWKIPVKEKTIANANSSDIEISENEDNPVISTDKNKFKCDLCDFEHCNENHIILHKGTHRGLKETQCPFCLKIFQAKNQCMKHMVQTHLYTENQCEICGLCFDKLSSFDNHKLQHDAEENPLFCTICKRQFKTIKTFKKHAIRHRADRPRYTCEYCGKVFVDRYTRTVHLRKIHKKEQLDTQKSEKRQKLIKERTCIICNQSFQSKEHLNTHMKNKHDAILKPVASLPES